MHKFQYVLFIFAIAFLGFVAGGLIVLNKAFPYQFLYSANLAGHALFQKKTQYNDPYRTDLWRKARDSDKGVVVYDPAKAYNGYTLYTSGSAQKAYLIDMHGRVVHEWHMTYRSFWDESAEVKHPVPASNMFITRAWLYPNGSLLADYEGVGDTPYGYGLVKMDKDSRLIWKYLAHTHHSLDVGPDGKIYVLTQEIVNGRIERFLHLKSPRIDDFVVVLSPDGKVLETAPVMAALLNSTYARLLANLPWFTLNGAGDYLHTNSVQVITPQLAKHFPYGRTGDVLISLREMNTIGVLDPATDKLVWALHGPWIGQHDPRLLPNGDIILFDNNGHFGPGGNSQVVEFNPTTLATVWSYAGDRNHYFQSTIRGGEWRLPNGNTLITEEQAGTLLEVTPDGKIVWEFVNPVRGGPQGEYIPIVSVARRFTLSDFGPAFRQEIEQKEQESGP